jgi:WhiB family transcriptional regulator, redox-sensing transcriptional regulator
MQKQYERALLPVLSGSYCYNVPWTQEWTLTAACQSEAPDALFVSGAAQHRAKSVCRGCSVRTECLADALDNRVEFGVWGGLTERERRALLRRRPNVTSWQTLLQTAMADFENSDAVVEGAIAI